MIYDFIYELWLRYRCYRLNVCYKHMVEKDFSRFGRKFVCKKCKDEYWTQLHIEGLRQANKRSAKIHKLHNDVNRRKNGIS